MFSIFLSVKKSVILFCILCFQGDLTSVTWFKVYLSKLQLLNSLSFIFHRVQCHVWMRTLKLEIYKVGFDGSMWLEIFSNEWQSMVFGGAALPAMMNWRLDCKPADYGHWWGWMTIILWLWLILIFNSYAAGNTVCSSFGVSFDSSFALWTLGNLLGVAETRTVWFFSLFLNMNQQINGLFLHM